MNYFFGLFLDSKTRDQVKNLIGSLGQIFDAQSVPVKWVKPENFHISVLFLGNKLNIIEKSLMGSRLNKLEINPFELSLDRVKLGISSRYRELMYLEVSQGAETLRDIVYALSGKLKMQRKHSFIPHLTLARIKKDLSDEEFHNLVCELNRFNKSDKMQEICFSPRSMDLIESDYKDYKVLKKVDIS